MRSFRGEGYATASLIRVTSSLSNVSRDDGHEWDGERKRGRRREERESVVDSRDQVEGFQFVMRGPRVA